MNQLDFKLDGRGPSQCDLILAALQARFGARVPMTDLWRASGAFAVHSRIADLRKRGYVIEQSSVRQPDGTIHSFYELTGGTDLNVSRAGCDTRGASDNCAPSSFQIGGETPAQRLASSLAPPAQQQEMAHV